MGNQQPSPFYLLPLESFLTCSARTKASVSLFFENLSFVFWRRYRPLTGCLGSKVIVAINKDKESNIFSVVYFGIVGDYKEVLPALTEKLKELLSK